MSDQTDWVEVGAETDGGSLPPYVIEAGGLLRQTYALLSADLAHDDGVIAFVYGDTMNRNGIYLKSGASGVGNWVYTLSLTALLTMLNGQNSPADPTAIASDVAVNGSALTYQRSDSAPAVQKGDNSQFGLMKADNASLSATAGVIGQKSVADKSLFANISGGAAVPSEHTLSAILDAIFGSTQGDILYRDSTLWKVLAPGTANNVLATGGVGANPSWVSPSGTTGDAAITRFTAAVANPGFDPAMIYNSSITLSNSNKTATPVSSSPYNYCYGTTARYTGKRYWEVVPGSISFCAIGATGSRGHILDVDTAGTGLFGQRYVSNVGWTNDGKISSDMENGSGPAVLATYATWSAGNVLSFALDLDNLLMWFRVGSGNWNNNASADPATGTLGLPVPMLLSGCSNSLIWPGMNLGNTSATTLRLLAADFTQTVPSGFSAWGA